MGFLSHCDGLPGWTPRPLRDASEGLGHMAPQSRCGSPRGRVPQWQPQELCNLNGKEHQKTIGLIEVWGSAKANLLKRDQYHPLFE